MRHIVLTRFNVRLLEEMPPPDEAWIRNRLQLFERITAPSVAGQSTKVDMWLVFCDAGSPGWLSERIARVATLCPVSGLFGPDTVTEALAAVDGEPMITTRLDNDDAIASDFSERVRAAATLDGFINFPRGLELAGEKLYRRSDHSNAFISRAGSSSTDTIWHTRMSHSKLSDHFDVRQVDAPAMWLQVIHEGNLVNTVTGVRTSGADLRRFSIDVATSDRGVLVDRTRSWARRVAGTAKRTLARRGS